MNKESRSQVSTGIILIAIGLLFFLNTIGYNIRFNWSYLVHFWPMILIFIGLNMLLRRTPVWWLVPIIIVVFILGIFVWGPPYHYNYGYNFHFNPFQFFANNRGISTDNYNVRSSIYLDDNLKELDVVLNMGAGKIDIGTTRDKENLYEADLYSGYGKPTLDYDLAEGSGLGYLLIESQQDKDWLDFNSDADDWQIGFNGEIPMVMEINTGAGEFDFDLRQLQIKELKVNVGAGELDIKLGEYTAYLELNSGASDVTLEIPEEIGIEIKTTGIINANNFLDEGLIKTADNSYQSENFQEASKKTKIQVTAPASNIKIKY